ncbi:MAG TPA: nuclear transport factor 2 family protein [Lacunisphaera sp.]|nr:nuclear transport factor 2 family protein [Lacunisphaera sp.]
MNRIEFLFRSAEWKRSAGLSLLLTLFALPACGAPASADDPVAAVLAANDRMIAAANRLDTDAFFADIVSSDETRIVQDGRLFATRAEAMAAVRAGSQAIASLDRRLIDPHVTLLAPGVALLTATGTTAVTLVDGRRFDNRFAVTLVFVLRDDQWKLFHGHYSLPNPPPS